MSTSLTVGKSRLATITLITNGLVDTTTALSTSSGNAATLRVAVNPDNPRQVAVTGVGAGNVNANVTANGHTAQSLFAVSAAAPPADGPTFGAWGDEIDPPSWA